MATVTTVSTDRSGRIGGSTACRPDPGLLVDSACTSVSDVRRRGVSSPAAWWHSGDEVTAVKSISVSSACRRRTVVVVSEGTGAAVVVASSTLTHESLVDVWEPSARRAGAEYHGRSVDGTAGCPLDVRQVEARSSLYDHTQYKHNTMADRQCSILRVPSDELRHFF